MPVVTRSMNRPSPMQRHTTNMVTRSQTKLQQQQQQVIDKVTYMKNMYKNRRQRQKEPPIPLSVLLDEILHTPLVTVNGLDKDSPKMRCENYEAYIKRRGLTPKIHLELLTLVPNLPIIILLYKNKEEQYKLLADLWNDYDKVMKKHDNSYVRQE